jgi:hypothetical protein
MIHANVLFSAERPSFGRRAALAAEMLVNFSGIS